jgi:hypothetical protein
MRYVHLRPDPGMNLHLKATLLAGVFMVLAPGFATAQSIEGTSPFVAHLVFRPLLSVDAAVLGPVASLEDLPAHCAFAGRDDVVCVLTDSDGDKIFSTFDGRDADKSQPKMVCGTRIIAAGTGKYKAIPERQPLACISIPPDRSRRRDCYGIPSHGAGGEMIETSGKCCGSHRSARTKATCCPSERDEPKEIGLCRTYVAR